MVYVEKANRWLPPVDQLRKSLQVHDLAEVLSNERKRLLELNETIPVILRPEAEDKIDDYARKLDSELDKERDNFALYRQSLGEHELKLATVDAICNGHKVLGPDMRARYILPKEDAAISECDSEYSCKHGDGFRYGYTPRK